MSLLATPPTGAPTDESNGPARSGGRSLYDLFEPSSQEEREAEEEDILCKPYLSTCINRSRGGGVSGIFLGMFSLGIG